ncbi:sugar phosphate isomerase/epimerase family protein [[Eubacterium] cellulosolvens]
MKIGFEAGSFATAGYRFDDYIKIASDLGFQYVELWIDRKNLWPLSLKPKEKKKALETLQENDIDVVSTCPVPFKAKKWEMFYFEYNLAHPNERERKKAVTWAKKSMSLTKDLGAEVMLTLPGKIEQPSFMESKVSYRQYFSNAIKSLKECAKYAEEIGLILGVENAVVGNFGDRPEELHRIVSEVGSEKVKAYLDVANANPFFSPIEYIRTLKGMLAPCLHITDNDGTHPDHLPIGMGTMNFPEILRELKAIGWDGYLFPEIFYAKNPKGGLKRSKEKLIKLLQTV